VTGGTIGLVFTLPEGVRPASFRTYAIRCSGGIGYVEVSSVDGGVRVFNSGGANCTDLAALDGFEFRPDN